MNIRTQVREFMRAAKQPVHDEPQPPCADNTNLRIRLISEEFYELLAAFYKGCDNGELLCLKSSVRRLLEQPPKEGWQLAEVADALADIDYVVEGMRQTLGINGPAVAKEVHNANMRKFSEGCYKRPDGKHMKPPGWVGPDIEKALTIQNEPQSCEPSGFSYLVRPYRGIELRFTESYLYEKTNSKDSRHMMLVNKVIDDQEEAIKWIEVSPAYLIAKLKRSRRLRIYLV